MYLNRVIKTPPVIHQDEPTCVFCRKHVKDDENCVTLKDKGSKSINATSEQCDDSINTVVGQIVHVDMNMYPTLNDDTAMPRLCLTDTTVALQQRMSRTIAEVDELHRTLTSREICVCV